MTTTYLPDTPRKLGEQDAPHMIAVTPADDARAVLINRVSWGAVLAGVVIMLVAQLVLNMIGLGIGASTIDPGEGAGENPSVAGFSIGAGIWWTVSGILAALAGGYVAGRLTGQPTASTAGWHGLTAWAFSTLIIFYLLTSTIGGLIGGAFSTVSSAGGSVVPTAGSAVQAVATNVADPFASIEQSMRAATSSTDPAALRDTAISAVRATLTGDQSSVEEARTAAAKAIASSQNIPIEQATTQVQEYEKQYTQIVDQAKQKATQAADIAAKAVSRGALFGSIALLLGALAALLGGRAGAVQPTMSAYSGRAELRR